MKMAHVDIGFLEETSSWLLKSHFFPSKVGGKPSWLDLKQLPNTEELLCKTCNQPMIFLCQVYAPLEEKPSCFHRTLFIFICRNSTCCVPNERTNLIVFRSQLPLHNEFYSAEPPPEEENNVFEIEQFVKTCEVCGAFAPKHCSKCKTVTYCSREHQVSDWKKYHKTICSTDNEISRDKPSLLFKEWELIIEEEIRNKENESADELEKKQMQEYERLVVEGKVGTLSDIPEAELQSHAVVDEDKVFLKFRKQISENPDQVIRYNRGGPPLWIAAEPLPEEIPPCEYCNSPRQFEFQILPQLLHRLDEFNLDWGVLAIYTCKESCSNGPCYKKEFIFKQDVYQK